MRRGLREMREGKIASDEEVAAVFDATVHARFKVMNIHPRGRPPFRADHIGSLLRPPPLRQAFRRHASGEIADDAFARIQDESIRDAVRMQEEIGLAGRDRRRVPARFLLGPVRGAHRGLRDPPRAAQVSRRPRRGGRVHRALCDRADAAHASACAR